MRVPTFRKKVEHAHGSHYDLTSMCQGVNSMLMALTSTRGAQKCFQLFSLNNKVPSWVTIQNWLLKYGLYELQKAKPKRKDWIFILDIVVQKGNKKCLVILGVPKAHLESTNYQLTHQDVEVLQIVISKQFTGEKICGYLEEVSEEVGVPFQIVSDHGSDIKKGVELFCSNKGKETICTYDITHKLANLLRNTLEKEPTWKTYQKDCLQARNLMLQTELSFLVPPQQKCKARYLNVKPLIEWRDNIQRYDKEKRESQLKPIYQADVKKLSKHIKISMFQRRRLKALSKKTYKDKDAFLCELRSILGDKLLPSKEETLVSSMDIRDMRFETYLGWTKKGNEEDFTFYSEIMCLVEIIEKEVKRSGLSKKTKEVFNKPLENISIETEKGKLFLEKIIDYLESETSALSEDTKILGTSDVIESLFGKYKQISGTMGLRGIGKMILTIPAMISDITLETMKMAIENTRQSDVKQWIDENVGPSLYAMRKEALSAI